MWASGRGAVRSPTEAAEAARLRGLPQRLYLAQTTFKHSNNFSFVCFATGSIVFIGFSRLFGS